MTCCCVALHWEGTMGGAVCLNSFFRLPTFSLSSWPLLAFRIHSCFLSHVIATFSIHSYYLHHFFFVLVYLFRFIFFIQSPSHWFTLGLYFIAKSSDCKIWLFERLEHYNKYPKMERKASIYAPLSCVLPAFQTWRMLLRIQCTGRVWHHELHEGASWAHHFPCRIVDIDYNRRLLENSDHAGGSILAFVSKALLFSSYVCSFTCIILVCDLLVCHQFQMLFERFSTK